ncbi:kinetochore protein Nuf2 isoform X3 [Molossus molossus]|uniref:kinetochore protein Nuf2 isoform X3 n=1 Tax=Molossus molossus TaxID=27622 RepID=UPI001746E325|nr:kinetochore protein Nuf2 isoform X3 [Molossus molossus]
METLSFPRYSVAEIVTHVRNKILTGADGKNLSKNDLYPNPKPEVLHTIYLRALQIVYGTRLEHFYMMPVNSDVMYPHLMEGFLPVSNLFIHLNSFLPICRVNDFETADILYPKAKRTSRFLSGIINFIHFRDACRETYMEYLWQHKSSVDKLQQLNAAHQEALMKLEKLDSVPAEEQAEFKQLSDEIQELQQLLNQDFRQKTTSLQDRNAQKKADILEKTKRLNELKLSVVSLKEAQESLKTKIVDSPEKLKNYKEKMKDTVQKLKNSRQEVMEKYEVYRDSVDGLPSCQLEVQLYQKKIQDLAQNRETLAGVLKELFQEVAVHCLCTCLGSLTVLVVAEPAPGGPDRERRVGAEEAEGRGELHAEAAEREEGEARHGAVPHQPEARGRRAAQARGDRRLQ